MKKIISVLSVLALTLSLNACLKNNGPDEYSVMEAAPLSMPPNFELRPPKEGESIAAERRTNEAQEILTGSSNKPASTTNYDDSWLVEKAGGANRDANIREKLEPEVKAEVKEAEEEKQGFWSRLFGKKEPKEDADK